MPAAEYDASLTEMQAAHAVVDEIAARLSAGLTEAGGQVSELLSTGWKGAAARSFADGWEEWAEGAGELVRALATTGRLLDTAEATYRARDEATAAAMSEIRAVLG